MAGSLLQNIYDSSPGIVRTLFLNAYALRVHKERYGARFTKTHKLLSETQYYSRDEIEAYQNNQLQVIITHSYKTVPYYRNIFDGLGLKPKDIQTRKDLSKLPVLTKEIIRNNFNNLISTDYKPEKLVHGHTSGTTGAPLDILWDINTCVYTNAVDWRQKNWAGIQYGDRIALLLGRMVVPTRKRKPPFWVMDHIHNQLWCSAFHLSDENLAYYIKKLKQFRPAALEGYPSTVYLLARYLNDRRETLPLRSVLTSSETLYPLQREAIENAFQCKVFDFYGMAERTIFSTECEVHSDSHLNFEYGLTEIIDDHDLPVDSDKIGTVVTTGLQNFGMPLIRYKTSDVSSISSEVCACGRSMPLLNKITTKAEDIIVCPDGRFISPSVLTHPFKPMHNIEKSQIIQQDINNIVIKIVKRPAFKEEEAQMLLDAFSQRVGNDINVNIEYVDDIARSKSGKYRWVISNVVKDIYDFNQDF